MRYFIAALLVLIILGAVAIDQIIKYGNECEAHGGTAMSEEVGSVGNVPIFDSWREGPNGERLVW